MFFISQGIHNYKDVNLYYQELLDLGCLSYNKEYSYDSDMLSDLYRENECEELLGARVASGKAVCRHTSFELSDLQNKLGNQATNLIVKPETQRKSNIKKMLYIALMYSIMMTEYLFMILLTEYF